MYEHILIAFVQQVKSYPTPRIVEVHPDSKGVFETISVAFRIAPGDRQSGDILDKRLQDTAKAFVKRLNHYAGPLECQSVEQSQGIICMVGTFIIRYIVDIRQDGSILFTFQSSIRPLNIRYAICKAYEDELVLMADYWKARRESDKMWQNQPWVQAILRQRQRDNANKVPYKNRQAIKLTQDHASQVGDRIFGYPIQVVEEEEYIRDNFKDGIRIT